MWQGCREASTSGPFFSFVVDVHLSRHNCDFTTLLLGHNFSATQRMKTGELSVATHCFCAKTPQPMRQELKRLYCVLNKVLVCLCRISFTHRLLCAHSVCLLAAAEFHPELSFPNLHQTLRHCILTQNWKHICFRLVTPKKKKINKKKKIITQDQIWRVMKGWHELPAHPSRVNCLSKAV